MFSVSPHRTYSMPLIRWRGNSGKMVFVFSVFDKRWIRCFSHVLTEVPPSVTQLAQVDTSFRATERAGEHPRDQPVSFSSPLAIEFL